MKYNKTYTEQEDFEKYELYLKTIEHKFPVDIYKFVADSRRHDLGKDSLHDTWLTKVNIETNIEKRNATITLVFLGAYHDREFYFYFDEVRQYKINQSLQDISRDLITFEIDFELNCYSEEQIVFRCMFSGDEEIEIYCNDLKIKEKLL